MRVPQGSAEAVVVKTPAETREERSAEGSRESNRPTIPVKAGAKMDETWQALQYRQPLVTTETDGCGGFRAKMVSVSVKSALRRKEASDDAQ